MWKHIKVGLLFLLIIGTLGIVSSAYYVTDPLNCPNNYQSQTCSGSDLVCGYSGGVTYCYDMSSLNPPGGSTTTTGSGGSDYTCSDTTCSGGFITDCYAYDGSVPHCDNGGAFWCDRNPTCYNKHVQTTCTGGSFVASSCSATCTTNYFACDGDTTDGDGCEIHSGDSCGSSTGTIVYNQCYSATAGNCTSATRLDCDDSDSDGDTTTCNAGNGCEILIGGACFVGSLLGTYDTTCSGGAGVCIVTPQNFITATNTEGASTATNPFLWGTDYGIGQLINISWSGGGGFFVNGTGAYFNNTLLGTGGSGISWAEAINGTLMSQATFNTNYSANDEAYRLDTNTWNSSSDIWTVVYNNTFANIDEPHWTDNFTKYNATWSLTGTGISWAEVINGTVVQLSTLLAFNYYNSTDFDINDYLTTALFNTNYSANDEAYRGATNTSYYLVSNPYGYLNTTINTSYYLATNPFGFYNVTTIGNLPNTNNYWNTTFATFNKTYADTLYAPLGGAETDPYWTSNFTLYNSSWTQTINDSYRTLTNNTFTSELNMTSNNITYVDCIILKNGAEICGV